MNLANEIGQFNTTILSKKIPIELLVLRRMRILRRIGRKEAAAAISRSPKLIERFENGRVNISVEKRKQLVRRYRYTWEEYLRLLGCPDELPELPSRSTFKSNSVPRIHGRKYQKQIGKAARVLKSLRKMKGWSQPEAAKKCGWSRSCIDHLENGRVDCSEEKIAHVLLSYGSKRSLYEELMNATLLRDEVIEDSHSILEKLDNDKLRAVKALLDNFR